jgi:hypothetical protein
LPVRPRRNPKRALRGQFLRPLGCGVWRQDQIRVVDDVVDMTVVADEADPVGRPLQPHQIAGLHGLRILVDRDHLASIEPGGGKAHRGAARVDAEEHAHIGGAAALRVARLDQPDVVGQHRAQPVEVAPVEQSDIASHGGRRRARRGLRRRLGFDGLEPGAPAREVGLHRIDREVEQSGDFLQRLIEHVLENHHASLHNRKLHESRHRSFDHLTPHKYLLWIWTPWIDDLAGRLDGFGRANRAATQQVDRAVVSNLEHPGAQRRDLLQFVQGDVCASEGVLHHILTLDHRAHQARAVAVQLRPQLAGERQELRLARRRRRGWACAQAASPSRIVIPVSPFKPRATLVA